MLMSFAVSTSYFYLCLQAFQFKQMHIWYALDRVLCAWNDLMPYPYLMMQGILYLDAIVYIDLLFWSGDFGWKIYHTDILLCSYWLSSVNFLCYLWWWFCAYIWTAWSRYKCCGSRWANSASLECCAWSYSSCWTTFERRSQGGCCWFIRVSGMYSLPCCLVVPVFTLLAAYC